MKTNTRTTIAAVFILVAVLVFASPGFAAGASSTKVNTSIMLWADAINGAQFMSGLTVNTTIVGPGTNVLVDNVAMTPDGTGRWFYNYTPTIVGTYYIINTYYNTTAAVSTLTDAFDAYENTPEETTNMIQAIFTTFLLFAVGVLLTWLGYYIGNALLILVGGVWFIGNSVGLYFTGQGFTAPMLFALVGIGLCYYAIEKLMLEYERRKKLKDSVWSGDDE